METTKWTKEQMEAISDAGCNLLVAAGAGAGKTAVLVERIIQKLLDDKNPVDIDRLLVVTFTNAAAAEMRERIGDALIRELEKRPEEKALQRQLALLNRANVMTIHSFCLSVIRSNYHLLDIDPNFRVCDETESVLLKEEVMEELFEDSFEHSSPEFINLINAYGERDDRKVQKIILNLYRFAISTPWPEQWLEDIAEDFNLSEEFQFGCSSWAKIIIKDLKLELQGCLKRLYKALDIIKGCEVLDFYRAVLEKDVSAVTMLCQCQCWKEFQEGFRKLSFDTMPSRKLEGTARELREKVKAIRDDVKKTLVNTASGIFNYGLEVEGKLREMYPNLKTLSNLTVEFNRRFSLKKRERGIIDFNDIEHFTLNIFSDNGEPSETARVYRNMFEEILIDEYQDSNMVQEVIMNMISRKEPGNIFMVGDVKQSIYRFRHARPELFLSKYNEYGTSVGEPGKKIKLFKNFRSRREIIDGVNFVFRQLMSESLGELEYNSGEMLEAGADYPENQYHIELHIMDRNGTANTDGEALDNDEGEEEDLDSIQLEARMAAIRIKELMDSDFQVYDRSLKNSRKVTWRDIVILMRATEKWAKVYLEELSAEGIPVFADTSTGYFETTEIKTIMSLLQAIDNPLQDIPLIALMRSPIFAFSPEELIDLRSLDNKLSFYEICRGCEISDESLKNKVESFLNRLRTWRKRALYVPVDEFIWYLYSETSYYSYVGSLPQGVQRQANLRLLFQRAREFEKTSYKGLFNFINFIDKLKNSSGDMGSAKILGENEDVVRIMSIHKSKGLEFPVVILAGTGKGFNLMDMNQSILFHQELGFGPDYVDYGRRISYPTLVKQVIRKQIKKETLSEEMRILYVAFTRAKEKLIITGTVKNLGRQCEKWCDGVDKTAEKISEYYLLNSKSFMDWLGAVAARSTGGGIIRELGGGSELTALASGIKSDWSIKMWDKHEVTKGCGEDKEIIPVLDLDMEITDGGIDKEVNRRLQWEYKYLKLGRIPAKISVSELKAGDQIQQQNLKKPSFLEKRRGPSGAERGTIMHLVMQHLNLDRIAIEEIREQLLDMVNKEFITKEEMNWVSAEKIMDFFNTNLGKRMAASVNLKREVPFFIELSAAEVYPELDSEEYKNEKIVLQGIIDCYFEEQDGLVLLDYKTDYVDNSAEIAEKYKRQVELYANALAKVTGKKIKEKYLYLFHTGEIIDI